MSKKVIIIDLDNCLADDEWRIPFIEWNKVSGAERYHQYHMLAAFDKAANKEVLLPKFHNTVIFTARPTFYAAPTTEWLRRNHVQYKHLFMRNNRDTRKSFQIKETMLNALLQDPVNGVAKEDIVMAYDDHPAIIDMYRANGILATRLSIHETSAYKPEEGYKP